MTTSSNAHRRTRPPCRPRRSPPRLPVSDRTRRRRFRGRASCRERRPCALMSSTAMRAPRTICSPIAASDPVIGPTTAILMSCARALCRRGPGSRKGQPRRDDNGSKQGQHSKPPEFARKGYRVVCRENLARRAIRCEGALRSAGAVLLSGAPAERPVRLVEPGILPHHLAGAGMEERDRHDEPENRRRDQQPAD